MRKRIFEIIEVDKANDKISKIYDIAMIIIIMLSIIPLMFKESNNLFVFFDIVAAIAFAVDYILGFITADYKLKKGKCSFLLYPFTLSAIVTILCILPSFRFFGDGLKVLRILRMFVAFRAFKAFKYSESVEIIKRVIVRQKVPLLTVCSLAVMYIVISALIVFNIEPDTFPNFFEALYWATMSLTTIGYGDYAPISVAGKAITMISTIVGMAIIALPSGIVTAGYIHEVDVHKDPDGALDELENVVKL